MYKGFTSPREAMRHPVPVSHMMSPRASGGGLQFGGWGNSQRELNELYGVHPQERTQQLEAQVMSMESQLAEMRAQLVAQAGSGGGQGEPGAPPPQGRGQEPVGGVGFLEEPAPPFSGQMEEEAFVARPDGTIDVPGLSGAREIRRGGGGITRKRINQFSMLSGFRQAGRSVSMEEAMQDTIDPFSRSAVDVHRVNHRVMAADRVQVAWRGTRRLTGEQDRQQQEREELREQRRESLSPRELEQEGERETGGSMRAEQSTGMM